MERFKPPHGDLFSRGTTENLRDSIYEDVRGKIFALSDDYILNVDEESYINYIVEEYTMECPVIHYSDSYINPRKVLVDSEYLPRYYLREGAIERDIYRLYIPYSGDSGVLKFRPMTFLSWWPNITVGSRELYVDILDIDGQPETIKREIGSYKSTLEAMIGYLNTDINEINRSLQKFVCQTFLSKKETVKNSLNKIAEIGLPIKKQNPQPNTYSVPTVQKRFKQPEVRVASTTPSIPDPTIAENVYFQILQCIQDFGQGIERMPGTYMNKGEEDIRGLFLAHLSSYFQSFSSTGESFNSAGKTDIMIKQGNDILFVAECKIWKGASVLSCAISQLLSYLTWRDSKTSLLIFVRKQQLSSVIESVKHTVPNHPNYVSTDSQPCDTWLNYTFCMKEDRQKMVKMAVQVFDFKDV